MAQVIALIDDISGEGGAKTIPFAFVGVSYEIDLSPGNAKAFRAALGEFADHARKAGRPGGAPGSARRDSAATC